MRLGSAGAISRLGADDEGRRQARLGAGAPREEVSRGDVVGVSDGEIANHEVNNHCPCCCLVDVGLPNQPSGRRQHRCWTSGSAHGPLQRRHTTALQPPSRLSTSILSVARRARADAADSPSSSEGRSPYGPTDGEHQTKNVKRPGCLDSAPGTRPPTNLQFRGPARSYDPPPSDRRLRR